MPIYGPWPSATTPGAYDAIADQATFNANSAALTAYKVTPNPAPHVLAGDNPASPQETVCLLFPDATTASNVIAAVNMPPSVDPPPLPAEVPMYRINIVMKQTTSAHGGTLYDRVPTFIATLPAAQQVVVNQLWPQGAPTLETNGSFAQGFKAWEGLSDAAWAQLISAAVNMAL